MIQPRRDPIRAYRGSEFPCHGAVERSRASVLRCRGSECANRGTARHIPRFGFSISLRVLVIFHCVLVIRRRGCCDLALLQRAGRKYPVAARPVRLRPLVRPTSPMRPAGPAWSNFLGTDSHPPHAAGAHTDAALLPSPGDNRYYGFLEQLIYLNPTLEWNTSDPELPTLPGQFFNFVATELRHPYPRHPDYHYHNCTGSSLCERGFSSVLLDGF